MSDDPNAPRSGGDNRDAGRGGDDAFEAAPHDAVGAYLLDALPEEERVAFAGHVPGCDACRRSLTELAPVVAALPRLLEVAPEFEGWVASGNVGEAPPAPSANLRDRILAAAVDDRRAAAAAPTDGTGGVRVAGSDPVDGARRVGAGTAAVAAAPTVGARLVPFRGRSRFGGGWPVAAALALATAGSVVWALAMQDRVADQAEELAAQRAEIEEMRAANALAFAMEPTEEGPSGARGDLFYDPRDGLAMLHVDGLPALPEDRAYQVWMLKGPEPIPSATFAVDGDGDYSMAMEADLSEYDAIALTVEPAGGSRLPTSAPILRGEMGRAS